MLKNILKNKNFINASYYIVIIIAFLFLLYKMRYAIVIYDDVIDLILYKFKFYHGRFLTEILAALFVNWIPSLLGINIQNFALISENIIKSLTIVFFTIVINKGFFIWKKSDTIYKPLLFIFSFLTLYFVIIGTAGSILLHTLQFFFGYILPLPFFIITWYKLSDYYINNKELTPTDTKILILLSLFIAQANELVCIILFIILSIIIIEKIIKEYIFKIKENNKWVIYSFISLILMSDITYTSAGFIEILNKYKTTEILSFSFQGLTQYLHIFLDKIVLGNILIIISIISAMYIILKNKENNIQNKKVFLFLSYSFLSIFLFLFSLFFIGETCNYAYGNTENYRPYWLLYKPILFSSKILLYTFVIYLFGYMLNNYEHIKIKKIILIFFLIGNFLYLKNSFYILDEIIYPYEAKRTMYLLDKFSIFYFNRGETAILPCEELNNLFTIKKDNAIMPYDLKTNTYQNKIYYNEFLGELVWPYLLYIKKVYGIKNIDKGMKFTTLEESINEYKKRGGIIEPNELKKLDFSKIKKENK